MIMVNRRFMGLAALSLGAGACGGGQGHLAAPAPVPATDFTATLSQASQDAGAGRYGVADKLLADYTVRFPASSDAVESMYWRAIYKLDPANQGASPRDASVLLDGYLASPSAPHRSEALTLKRIASVLETRAAMPAATVVKVEAAPTDKSKDEEVSRLKDELSRANAELDRIKRRLAQPTKP